jgi:hypothetical protein
VGCATARLASAWDGSPALKLDFAWHSLLLASSEGEPDDVPSSLDDALFRERHATKPSDNATVSEGTSGRRERRWKRREWNREDGEYDTESASGLAKAFSGEANTSSDDAKSGERDTSGVCV